eukprot:CAMPEP_0175287738 /NCGR_PEP_ID=MMETSP0093-20121207/54440_1 /TAXON_ID=311494 /ORGANISM="Alexandrium monilatum, Strain CCMP3105" /LENGTH=44 /DNA_ID= /DNA_START= /DNA_END= /DNA_ORIENTATION=
MRNEGTWRGSGWGDNAGMRPRWYCRHCKKQSRVGMARRTLCLMT